MSPLTHRIAAAAQVIVEHMHVPDATATRRDQIACGLRAWEKRAGDGMLHFVLPSFPYKSQNTTKKVFGHLPDAGEAHTLDNLHGMMRALSSALQRKCQLVLYADGFVFHDIANVEERMGKAYLDGVRAMVEKKRYDENLIVWEWAPEVVSWSERQAMFMQEYGGRLQDTVNEVMHTPPLLKKYAGLKRFIADDLNVTDKPPSSAMKRFSGKMALIQLHRAKAIISSIHSQFPTSWRLTIHRRQPDLSQKLPIRLGCDADGVWRTPWQNTPVKLSDGGMLLVNRHVAEKAGCQLERLENGQPWRYEGATRLMREVDCDRAHRSYVPMQPS